ncbi:long-chain fatty acid--CoA ligase [Desulfococcus sp.]|uniref:AMP-dependent synthetase/ligase n=1 Tax=Desulfococcus sp. TaxID=2025834 RepID=UPI0035938B54
MYPYEKPDNLVELIETSVTRYPDNPFFGTKTRSGEYEWMTYREAGLRIDNLRAGLALLGVGRGDAVGIIANNRAEWAITAFAVYGLGARFIPMYENELVKVWRYIIQDSGIKVLFVANDHIHGDVERFRSETPSLAHVFVIADPEGPAVGEKSTAALERSGEDRPTPSIHPGPQDTAVLIYTSGTTGSPKGVLLTHGNFTSNVLAGARLYPHLNASDRSLSILPWAHSFGQTGELYLFSMIGGAIGFIESAATIVEDMAKVRPTFLIAVPRVFNRIYNALWQQITLKGGLAKRLFTMGLDAAETRRRLAAEGETPDLVTRLRFMIADLLVFRKIREKFGGRLHGAITGSATMNVEIGHFFADIGIPVYDCYGLTETAPAVTMNCPAANRPGSVGRPIDKVKVVIDRTYGSEDFDDGEIVVYGPNVMKGYHNLPEATAAVFTQDGGFRTGDRGRIDPDGYLFITGRIKEQYKLENGKYVFPAALEEEIKLLPWVLNAMVYGEGRAWNVCLLAYDAETYREWVRKQDPAGGTPEPTMESIGRTVADFLKGKFGGYEIPKKFILLSEDFTLDNGMLTQTMKLKRRAVLDAYMKKIEAAYAA